MILIYLLIIIAAVLFYIMYQGAVAVVLLLFLMITPVLLFGVTFYASRRLSAELRVETTVGSAGQDIPMTIVIKNPTAIPIGCVEVVLEAEVSSSDKPEKIRFDLPAFPNNTETLTTQFSSGHFGIVSIRLLRVKIFDMLRLWRFRLPARSISNVINPVLVLPDPLPIECLIADYSESGIESDVYSDKYPGDDSSEIFDIRGYKDGDRMSRIHWKLTAKEDKLMVKDHSLPLCDSCLLVADTFVDMLGSDPSGLYDTVILTIVSLSAHMLENGVRHRMICYRERSQELSEMPIYSDDEYAEAARVLLASGKIHNRPQTMDIILHNSSSGPRFGHVILVCTHADETTAEMLSESGLASRYTILLCTGENSFVPFAAETEIIPVYKDAIEQSLTELVI